MNDRLVYGVIGTGAIGGFVGFKLQEAGQQVNFMARGNYDPIKKNGLTLISGQKETHLQNVHIYQTNESMPQCDVVLLTTKTTSNHDLIPQLRTILKPGGVIIVLQNGIGYEKMIADQLKEAKVMGGIVYIKSSLVSATTIKHFSQQTLHLAPFIQEQKQTTHSISSHVVEDLRNAGLTIVDSQDLNTIRWKKLIFNMAFNGLSVALNNTMHQLLKNEVSSFLVQKCIDEATAAAIKCGAKFTKADIEAEFEKIKAAFLTSPDSVPSMKEDYDNNRPMELDSIYKNALDIAKEHGAELPFISKLYKDLNTLQTKKQQQQSRLRFICTTPANAPFSEPTKQLKSKL